MTSRSEFFSTTYRPGVGWFGNKKMLEDRFGSMDKVREINAKIQAENPDKPRTPAAVQHPAHASAYADEVYESKRTPLKAGGGGKTIDITDRPRNPVGGGAATTDAVGEEGGGGRPSEPIPDGEQPYSTMAVGEEGGGGRNVYGDPEGTMYAGGSPTFNESTGRHESYTGADGTVTKAPYVPKPRPKQDIFAGATPTEKQSFNKPKYEFSDDMSSTGAAESKLFDYMPEMKRSAAQQFKDEYMNNLMTADGNAGNFSGYLDDEDED